MCTGKINFTTCCFVFSLQSGVILTIVIFSTIFVGMVVMNTYTISILEVWTWKNAGGLSFAYLHAFFIIFGIIVAFLGAYREDPKLMYAAAFLIFIAFLLYLAASILAYIPSLTKYACFLHRCPDHIWMEDSYWRAYYFHNQKYVMMAHPEGEGKDGSDDFDDFDDDEHAPDLRPERGDGVYPYDENYFEGGIAAALPRPKPRPPPRPAPPRPAPPPPAPPEEESKPEEKDADNVQKKGSNGETRSAPRWKTRQNSEAEGSGKGPGVGAEPEDVKKQSKYRIRYPILGIVLSVFFNVLYLLFVGGTVLCYIAFANEIKRDEFESDYEKWLKFKEPRASETDLQ